jgi:methionine-rich copper-binding protein CopC
MKAGRVIRSIIVGALIILPGFATSAQANSITASVPLAGSVLTTSPNSISITTAGPLSEQGSLIVVNDPNGIAVDDGSITINENSAEVGLTELIKTGVYTVNYTLISDTEDPLTGSYTFMFNAPSSLGTPDPAPTTGNTIQVDRNLNGGSNAFVYTLLVLAAFVFIFLIWYAKQSFGGQRRPKRK